MNDILIKSGGSESCDSLNCLFSLKKRFAHLKVDIYGENFALNARYEGCLRVFGTT